MAIFKGAGVAIVTPMKEDFSVNYEKLEEIVNYQIENGTDAIIICGTTGEAATLSHEEHLDVIKAYQYNSKVLIVFPLTLGVYLYSWYKFIFKKGGNKK